MNSKTITGIVIAVLVVIFGVGGYLIGSRSKPSTATPAAVGTGSSAPTPASQPINHSTIIAELKDKLKENPKDADTLIRLGDTYFDLKQFSEAGAYYKKALDQKSSNTDVYNELGLSLHYTGNSGEGLKYIDEGIKRNPYHQRIWLTKGFVLAYGLGDLDGARDAWEKARTLNPESQVGKAASDFLAQFDKNKK